ncbi:MAG: hypothetical protein ABF760_05040 [Zymomonas mobilis]
MIVKESRIETRSGAQALSRHVLYGAQNEVIVAQPLWLGDFGSYYRVKIVRNLCRLKKRRLSSVWSFPFRWPVEWRARSFWWRHEAVWLQSIQHDQLRQRWPVAIFDILR